MKDLMKLFVETVGRYPSGNVQDELRSWAANEITTLRQQLAETEEKGRVLMDMCRDLKAQVTEYEKAGRMLSFSEWKKHLEREDVRECGHVVYRSPAEKSLLYAKYRQSCEQNMDSLLLRKQAEAVEAVASIFAVKKEKCVGEDMAQAWATLNIGKEIVDAEAQRLHQQADELEK